MTAKPEQETLKELIAEFRSYEAAERVDQRFGNKFAGGNRKIWKHCADKLEALAPALSRKIAEARLEEAKWWQDWYNEPDNGSQYQHDRAVQHVAELERKLS